jgi:hypothetical protein
MIRSALSKEYPNFTHLFYCFIMDWYRYQLLIHNVLPPTLPKQCGLELQVATATTDAEARSCVHKLHPDFDSFARGIHTRQITTKSVK